MYPADLMRAKMDRLNDAVEVLDHYISLQYADDREGWWITYVRWKNFASRWAAFYADERPEVLPAVGDDVFAETHTYELELLEWRRRYQTVTGEVLPPFTPWSKGENPPSKAAPLRVDTGTGSDFGVGFALAVVAGLVLLTRDEGP